jgi:hypothetical protein
MWCVVLNQVEGVISAFEFEPEIHDIDEELEDRGFPVSDCLYMCVEDLKVKIEGGR